MNLRQYKKKFFICLDNNGKKVYKDDSVELHLPHETKSAYQSIVYWNMIDGAFVDSHPVHVNINRANYQRGLRDYLNEYSICVKDKSFYDN